MTCDESGRKGEKDLKARYAEPVFSLTLLKDDNGIFDFYIFIENRIVFIPLIMQNWHRPMEEHLFKGVDLTKGVEFEGQQPFGPGGENRLRLVCSVDPESEN